MFNNFMSPTGFNDPTTNGSQLGPLSFGVQNTMAPGFGGGSGISGSAFNGMNGGGFNFIQDGAVTPTGGIGDWFGSDFFAKDGGASQVLAGVQTLGNLWNSYQNHKMAKKQFNFAREQWDTNLANQTQAYNTALEDRIRARHAYEERPESDTQAYLDEHSL